MKTFKQFTKEKKKEKGSGLAPAPIHFKHFEELLDIQPTGVIPTAIHFKNILKDKKLNEAKEGSQFKSWLKDRSDNAHLTSKKNVGAANNEIAKKLHSTNKFSDEHISHIAKYTGSPDDAYSHSRRMNNSLIKNKGVPIKAHKKSAEGLSDAIDKNRVQHKVSVYSGTSFDPRNHIDKNGRLKSHAFISATHHKEVAAGFAQKAVRGSYAPGHIMKIDLKPNDPATHVSHHSHWNDENETVINRNTTLQHHKTTSYRSPGEERWYHIHHMSVVPKK